MADFDVSPWVQQQAPARDQLELQHTRLLGLRVHRIVDSCPVWEGGRHLEVSWQKFDDMAITWSTVDVSTPPIACVTWPSSWRLNRQASLRTIAGNTNAGGDQGHLARRRHLAANRR